jgi:hypothetical protein
MDRVGLALSFAQATRLPVYPPSASAVSTKVQRRGEARGRGLAPSLDAAGVHRHFEQAAVCVGQDVALAPRDLLARVVAARALA